MNEYAYWSCQNECCKVVLYLLNKIFDTRFSNCLSSDKFLLIINLCGVWMVLADFQKNKRQLCNCIKPCLSPSVFAMEKTRVDRKFTILLWDFPTPVARLFEAKLDETLDLQKSNCFPIFVEKNPNCCFFPPIFILQMSTWMIKWKWWSESEGKTSSAKLMLYLSSTMTSPKESFSNLKGTFFNQSPWFFMIFHLWKHLYQAQTLAAEAF